jgi:cyclopropane-fatty-acyl-phospholipid synthase
MNTKLMNSPSLDLNLHANSAGSDAMPAQMKLIVSMLRKLEHGSLRIDYPNGDSAIFGDSSTPITLSLSNWNIAAAVMKSGDIGFAESYIHGDWHTDNLTGLIDLFIRNRHAAESLIYGTWWGNLAYRLKHLFHRNSRSGSRKNIHAHYDIGNNFYQLWLDPSMTYSSAIFSDNEEQTLEQAQTAKYQRIINELQLTSNARILEIGCGWGGFAELVTSQANVHLTGLTLSTEQLHFARQRLSTANKTKCTDLRLQDYRDVNGEFDAIASIEMFEAVGEAYWPSYFECVARNLKEGGRACIQTIVIDDALFERYRKGTDFIQQYIFPGGMLPSMSAFRKSARKYGLEVANEFTFGSHYGRTLSQWRRSFHQQLDNVRNQGFDDRFIRTWDFYLAYCEAGFIAGSIDVAQFTLIKTKV